jgi:hypothetical protein
MNGALRIATLIKIGIQPIQPRAGGAAVSCGRARIDSD